MCLGVGEVGGRSVGTGIWKSVGGGVERGDVGGVEKCWVRCETELERLESHFLVTRTRLESLSFFRK